VLCVVGGTGGAGATTLAVALARSPPAGRGTATLLLDADPLGGAIDLRWVWNQPRETGGHRCSPNHQALAGAPVSSTGYPSAEAFISWRRIAISPRFVQRLVADSAFVATARTRGIPSSTRSGRSPSRQQPDSGVLGPMHRAGYRGSDGEAARRRPHHESMRRALDGIGGPVRGPYELGWARSEATARRWLGYFRRGKVRTDCWHDANGATGF
jgi:hypothetical protein